MAPAMDAGAVDSFSGVRNMVLLRDSEVAKRLNVSRRQIWKMRAVGQLPEPIRVGTGSVRWREADIEGWIQAGCPVGWTTPTAGKAGVA